MKDQNPNFDFYTFNAPQQNETEKAADVNQEKESVVSEPNEIEQTVTDSVADTIPSTEDDAYARDIDRALTREKLRRSYSRLGWGFVAMTVAWYAVAQTLMDKEQVAHEHNTGVLVVTHDHRAIDVFDRLYVMEDGKIKEQ